MRNDWSAIAPVVAPAAGSTVSNIEPATYFRLFAGCGNDADMDAADLFYAAVIIRGGGDIIFFTPSSFMWGIPIWTEHESVKMT